VEVTSAITKGNHTANTAAHRHQLTSHWPQCASRREREGKVQSIYQTVVVSTGCRCFATSSKFVRGFLTLSVNLSRSRTALASMADHIEGGILATAASLAKYVTSRRVLALDTAASRACTSGNQSRLGGIPFLVDAAEAPILAFWVCLEMLQGGEGRGGGGGGGGGALFARFSCWEKS